MDIKSKEIYSEVYSVLNMLGESYIIKIPNSLYTMIKNSKSISYNPNYVPNISLDKQQIKKESLAIIGLIHLNYWCNSDEEKEQLKQLFKENEEKYQIELREIYNPDDIFKNRNSKNNIEEVNNTEIISMVEYKEKIWFKIIRKIKQIFGRR